MKLSDELWPFVSLTRIDDTDRKWTTTTINISAIVRIEARLTEDRKTIHSHIWLNGGGDFMVDESPNTVIELMRDALIGDAVYAR